MVTVSWHALPVCQALGAACKEYTRQSSILLGHSSGDSMCMGESGLLRWGVGSKAQGLRGRFGGPANSSCLCFLLPLDIWGEHVTRWMDGGKIETWENWAEPTDLSGRRRWQPQFPWLSGYWSTWISCGRGTHSTRGVWCPQPGVGASGSSFRFKADIQGSATSSGAESSIHLHAALPSPC